MNETRLPSATKFNRPANQPQATRIPAKFRTGSTSSKAFPYRRENSLQPLDEGEAQDRRPPKTSLVRATRNASFSIFHGLLA
jgi:hypothetical protein